MRSFAGFWPAVRLGREGADLAGVPVLAAGFVAGAGSGDVAGAVAGAFGGGAEALVVEGCASVCDGSCAVG